MKYKKIITFLFIVNLLLLCSLNSEFLPDKKNINGQNGTITSTGERPPITTQKEELSVCSTKEKIDLVEISESSKLHSLEKFQSICNSFVTDRHMVFIGMPNSVESARDDAKYISTILKEFASVGVTPVIIVEPFHDGKLLDLEAYLTGGYDAALTNFFWNLKEADVTERELGIWVPFPEANTPSMDYPNRSPEDFSHLVNTYSSVMRGFFPDVHLSILLDAKSYIPGDGTWSTGSYQSLIPYISNIAPGAINSIGIQGFPWKQKKDMAGGDVLEARTFLQSQFIIEAANLLEISEIWFNTGTLYGIHLNSDTTASYLTAKERSVILTDIISELTFVKTSGFTVWVNIFAEDKSHTSEAANWAYWGNMSEEHKDTFTQFVKNMQIANIPLSLFGE